MSLLLTASGDHPWHARAKCASTDWSAPIGAHGREPPELGEAYSSWVFAANFRTRAPTLCAFYSYCDRPAMSRAHNLSTSKRSIVSNFKMHTDEAHPDFRQMLDPSDASCERARWGCARRCSSAQTTCSGVSLAWPRGRELRRLRRKRPRRTAARARTPAQYAGNRGKR